MRRNMMPLRNTRSSSLSWYPYARTRRGVTTSEISRIAAAGTSTHQPQSQPMTTNTMPTATITPKDARFPISSETISFGETRRHTSSGTSSRFVIGPLLVASGPLRLCRFLVLVLRRVVGRKFAHVFGHQAANHQHHRANEHRNEEPDRAYRRDGPGQQVHRESGGRSGQQRTRDGGCFRQHHHPGGVERVHPRLGGSLRHLADGPGQRDVHQPDEGEPDRQGQWRSHARLAGLGKPDLNEDARGEAEYSEDGEGQGRCALHAFASSLVGCSGAAGNSRTVLPAATSSSSTRPWPGSTASAATCSHGANTKSRCQARGCGRVSRSLRTCRPPTVMRSMSSVRSPHSVSRSRPCSCSIAFTASRSSSGEMATSAMTTALR